MFVYKITSKASEKSYIGITMSTVGRRMSTHRWHAENGHDRVICRAIRKYGWSDFAVQVLYEASSVEELKMVERALIATHRTMVPFGYNVTAGGDGARQRKYSDEERSARSERAKRMHAEGRIPKRKKGEWKPTEEQRSKMSSAKSGWKPSEAMIEVARQRFIQQNPMRDPERTRRAALKRRGVKRTPEQCDRIRVGIRIAKSRRDNAHLA